MSRLPEIIGKAVLVAALWCAALFISSPIVVYGMKFWKDYMETR